MSVVFIEQELFNACRVLFGSEMQVTRGFLEYLQLSGIKSAYRKKVLETHPDRRINGGSSLDKEQDLFHAVQQAYENLISFLEAREHGYSLKKAENHQSPQDYKRPGRPSPTTSAYNRRTSSNNAKTAKFKSTNNARAEWKQAQKQPKPSAKGRSVQTKKKNGRTIPARKLLFGHYLYYSGITNWQTIVKALVWQRTKRPRIGEIGRQMGFLSNNDILTILRNRNLPEPFGQTAIKMGFLTANQLRLIVLQQKREQKKFGEYFTHKKIITQAQLNRLIAQFNSHNSSASLSRKSEKGTK